MTAFEAYRQFAKNSNIDLHQHKNLNGREILLSMGGMVKLIDGPLKGLVGNWVDDEYEEDEIPVAIIYPIESPSGFIKIPHVFVELIEDE